MEDTLIYTREQLERLDVPELTVIYKQAFEEDPHHNLGKTSFVNRILEKTNPEAWKQELEAKAAAEAEASASQSESQPVKDGIKVFKPNPAFKADQSSNQGIVSVELKNARRTGSLMVRDYTDTETGKLREFKDEHGNPRIQLITKNFKLDLSIERERLFYEHLKDHPVYVKCNNPALILKNQFQDSIDAVDVQEEAIVAKSIVMQLKEDEVRDFARILGVKAPAKTSAIVIKNEIYKKCDENPEFVITMWNHPQKEAHVLVRKAIDLGILEKKGHFFMFNQISLGTTADEILLYLMKTPEMLPGIRLKVEEHTK